ncbi:sialic acid-binding Ig-like lectin 14 [Saccopteryx bilineata]|uniref:sialic acid-binding Ig-like lectin 14 n=1 Tax=Saccopteryx bilineata TaxID=59482 RepID=UPI00338EBA11
MVPLLLLPLLWGLSLCVPPGTLQQQPGYELQVQRSVRVQEGLCVHVSCSFSYPWSPWLSYSTLYTYWYHRVDSEYHLVARNNADEPVKTDSRSQFLLTDPRNNDYSLSIRDARTSDSGVYLFRVERGNDVKYTYNKKTLNLQVTALTEKPIIHILEPLEAGRPTQLTCSLPGACEGGSPLTFSWVGAAVDSLNPQTLHFSVLTFTPKAQDHDTSLTCQVTRQWSSVTTERTIWLNVSYAPRNLTIDISFRNVTALRILQNTSSLPILEGEAVWLLCEADSNPPAELSWFRGSPALNATPVSCTATLELPRMGTMEEGEFSCRARHLLGSQHVSFSLSVQRSPPPRSCVTEEQQGSWPLVLTLIRGALMGAGFLLTYGLTWLYCTRCGGPETTRPTS